MTRDELPAGAAADLELALRAARAAGEVIARQYRQEVTAESKAGGKGETTATDRAAEAVILSLLAAESDHAVLSEEAGGRRDPEAACWVVDPLDGTTNYSRKLPLFCVSIALMRGRRPELGVVLEPLSGDWYAAQRGWGCYRNGQPARVSDKADPATAVVFLQHGYQVPDRQRFATVTQRLALTSYARDLGATALELAFVAAGAADGHVCSGDELWDFAAGMVLVEEAGGQVTDWRGRPWDGEGSYVLISNGRLHDYLVRAVGDLQEDD
ncbi:MAG: inositol monophosphatase [Gemmatimonadota bacterium]